MGGEGPCSGLGGSGIVPSLTGAPSPSWRVWGMSVPFVRHCGTPTKSSHLPATGHIQAGWLCLAGDGQEETHEGSQFSISGEAGTLHSMAGEYRRERKRQRGNEAGGPRIITSPRRQPEPLPCGCSAPWEILQQNAA